MHYTITAEEEKNGRWLAAINEYPGFVAYGESEEAAMQNARELAEEIETDNLRLKYIQMVQRRRS